MTKKQKPLKQASQSQTKQPFIDHVRELRTRLNIIGLSILAFGIAAYTIEHRLIDVLLKPAGGQQFIYTSPGGGVNFLFQVCLYAGVICSIPVIMYQCLKYVEPLIQGDAFRFITLSTVVSIMLAVSGMAFGYVVGLPNALHFLLHQFVTRQIQPLLTIQSYMAFVSLFMLGSAFLFQAPLVMFFINRIKPLTPTQLFKAERWVIVGSVILAAIMNPTPNVVALCTLAIPIIVTYQLGIVLIWYVNRRSRPTALEAATI